MTGDPDRVWSATPLPGADAVTWDEPRAWTATSGDTAVIIASDGFLPGRFTTRVWRSTRGERWVLVPGAVPGTVSDVATFRGRFVALGTQEAGDATGWHSVDGRRWTAFTVPEDPGAAQLRLASVGRTALLYADHRLCRAVGTAPSPAPPLADLPECVEYLSGDLRQWDRLPSPHLTVVFGLGDRWAALGTAGGEGEGDWTEEQWLTSADGRAWQASPRPFQDGTANWVGRIGSTYVAIGKGNAAADCGRYPPVSDQVDPRCHHVVSWTSADGSDWVRHVQELSVRTTYRPALPVVEAGGRLWSVVDDQVLVSERGARWRIDTVPWTGSTRVSSLASFGGDSLVVAGIRGGRPVAWVRRAR